MRSATEPAAGAVIKKIVINMGLGEGVNDPQKRRCWTPMISRLIRGQKPGSTKARKSMPPTSCATEGRWLQGPLRKTRCYEFIDRL